MSVQNPPSLHIGSLLAFPMELRLGQGQGSQQVAYKDFALEASLASPHYLLTANVK